MIIANIKSDKIPHVNDIINIVKYDGQYKKCEKYLVREVQRTYSEITDNKMYEYTSVYVINA